MAFDSGSKLRALHTLREIRKPKPLPSHKASGNRNLQKCYLEDAPTFPCSFWLPWLASHMDVNALDVTGADGESADLERAAADNVKRVVRGRSDTQSPWDIAAFLELKTVWHPIGQ